MINRHSDQIKRTIVVISTTLIFASAWAPPAMAVIEPGNLGELASPSSTRTVSLSQSFDMADKYNKELTAANWNLPLAKAAIRAAGAVPNPQTLVQTGAGNSFSFLFTGQTQQYGITQEFQTAGKRTKKVTLARANYGLAELQIDALRFDIHNRVRRAYSEVAAAEAYADLIESQRQIGAKLVDIASKRFDAGKAAKSEMLQAKLNVLQFDTQRNQAQGRLQQASAALAAMIGERPEQVEVIDVNDNGLFKLSAEKTQIVPAPDSALPRLETVIKTANESRPDLKMAQQQIYVNIKALTLAKTKRIPDVFIGLGGTFSNFAKSQPTGLNAVGNWAGTGLFFSVTAENPILYQYQGEVQLAKANLRSAQVRLELLQSRVGQDVVIAYNEVSVARQNIFELQKNVMPTAAEVARIARRGYQLGANDLSTAIVAQQQYQQTLSNYFDAVVAYQTAWADLEKAVGLPLSM
jgi:cobalt-zinc-cadmium efflux system outer membrane protein